MSAGDRVVLAATGHELLFTHAALWGSGALAAAADPAVRLGWTGGLTKTAVLFGLNADTLAHLVRDRAAQASDQDHWIRAGLPHEPNRALFSPRIKTLPDAAAWQALQQARRAQLDALEAADARLDLRLIAALGEPSSWHLDKGLPRQDRAASRLEMQPRNQGSEFVGTRLRSLADAVSLRTVDQVRNGLTGASRVDEAGGDRQDSRSAANLMPPRVTDNALAWAAMWGLSAVPVVHLARQPSRTATHVRWTKDGGLGAEVRAGHVVAPFWNGGWSWARLASVLSSAQLVEAVDATLAKKGPADCAAAPWLRERGVTGLLVVPIHTHGSTSSPERRASAGRVESLLTTRP